MRVALTVESLSANLTGIGRYCWELVQRLPQQQAIDDIRFFRNGQWVTDPSLLLTSTGIPRPLIRIPRAMRRLSNQLVSRRRLFHGPNYFLPKEADTGIITVHDLSVFRYPETHPAARLAQFERDFDNSLKRAAHIITDSETVRAELVDFIGWAPDRITAIPLGVSQAFQPRKKADIVGTLKRYGLSEKPYALCVSTIEPRKKIRELLEAWKMLPPATRSAWDLVLIGGQGWLSEDVEGLIDQGHGQGWLKRLGYVAEGDLPLLYAGADLFLYPSAYEGFGLPPIEAMASEVPTIVSNMSCLPEVTKGAALTVDPNDIPSFSSAIHRGLTDKVWREDARRDGLTVARSYRWDDCASRTAATYAQVAGELGL